MMTKHSTVSVLTATARTVEFTAFCLTVVRGPNKGQRHVSAGSAVVVGSDQTAHLCLSDGTVSRFHCEIAVIDGRVRLRDLGSKNGTVISGVAVQEGFLHHGVVLQLGNSDVRFELTTGRVSLPLDQREAFGAMVGKSVAMRRVFSMLQSAADSDVSVVLLGETGTGKDAAADAIHCASARADGPFVVVDCSAIPAELIESELFGRERGAFTGAHDARAGLFEAAHGGTIFLDEVGELPLEMQPKLLRVLESRSLRRVGGQKERAVDVRVIAATNRDLRVEVNEKRFRADLYYRLNVLEITLPTLRERLEDIPLLVTSLLPPSAHADLLTPSFLAQLATHSWPGNVRELRNHLERCLALKALIAPPAAGGPSSSAASSSTTTTTLPNTDAPLKEAREAWNRELEHRYLEVLLERHGQNVAAAARAAGVDRMYFYRLLWRAGLRVHKADET